MTIHRSMRQAGYTLIELMITVSILALLARIAYVSYISMVQKSNRSDAKDALVNDAQTLERCYSQYFYYQATGTQPACPTLQTQSSNKLYTIAATFPTTTSFTITATPAAGGSQANDSKCASFTIDNLGNQKATNSSSTDNSSYCWTGH